jgi:hypothetical protein
VSDGIAARIEIFRLVRDIPYHIDLRDRSRDRSCGSKAEMLQTRLKKIGLESRRICCRFKWADTPLPAALIAKAPGPDCGHEYLEVQMPDRGWIALDATWDSGLKKSGLPIAEWDGRCGTVLAVTPYLTHSPEQSAKIIAEINATPAQDWQKLADVFALFLSGFHQWLDQQRNKVGMSHA